MDYREKYETAIKQAKEELKACGDLDCDAARQILRFFPELKESEDERIRENIIATIHLYYGEPLEDEAKEMIAWLEKQGEHAKFRDSIQVGDKVTRNRDGMLVNLSQLKRVAKPADEVEPKFHKGEWITNGDYTWKIVEVKHLDYILQSQDGNIVDDTISHVDEQFHSFTIEDAKDGDVLCTYECDEPKIVFILKGIPKKHYALSYYCYYDIMYPHFAFDSVKGCLAPDDEDVKPATKEQCDLLFQNMKEVGYKWDAEKKELNRINKIEQSPAWSEEDEARFKSCIKVLQPSDKYDTINTKWLKSIKNRVQPKQEWSEYDKEMLRRCISATFDHGYLKECDWLKSLKQMNYWKPSDEQIEALDDFIYAKYPNIEKYGAAVKSLYQDLKKLREG